MNWHVIGEALIKRSFVHANFLVAMNTLLLSVGLFGAFYLCGVSLDAIRGFVGLAGFLICLPIMVVSLLLSASAREFLGLISYKARFNYWSELDSSLGMYNDKNTTAARRFLVDAVFWLVFSLSRADNRGSLIYARRQRFTALSTSCCRNKSQLDSEKI